MQGKTINSNEISGSASLLRKYTFAAVVSATLAVGTSGCTSTAPRINGPERYGQISNTFVGTVVGINPVRTDSHESSMWNGVSVHVIGMMRNGHTGIIGSIGGFFSNLGGAFANKEVNNAFTSSNGREVMVQLPGPQRIIDGKQVVMPGRVVGVLQTVNQTQSLRVGEYVDVVQNPNSGLCNIFPMSR